jgi:hypothetical protein
MIIHIQLDTILLTKFVTWETFQFPTGGSQLLAPEKTLSIFVIKEISHLCIGLLG